MYMNQETRQYFATERELKNVFRLKSKDAVGPLMDEMGITPLKWYGEETVYPFQEIYETYAAPKGIPRKEFFISVQEYVPYTKKERNMDAEIKQIVEKAGKINRQLHYHRLMAGSYEALFFMFGRHISKEDKEMAMRMLQGESPEDIGKEKGLSRSFVVFSCEKAINDIEGYCSLIRENRTVMASLLHLINQVVKEKEEKAEKKICNGILKSREPLDSPKKGGIAWQQFIYPEDEPLSNTEWLEYTDGGDGSD